MVPPGRVMRQRLLASSCDKQNACTFTGSWNDPITKKPVTARVVTRWTSPTTEQFEMWMRNKQGKEYKSMEMTYTKQ